MIFFSRGRVDTNTHSYFFRETPALNAVREWLSNYQATDSRLPAIWSAGCAGGEEAYSLAIHARELGQGVCILGTDINPDALSRAQSARYFPQSLRRMDLARQHRWFTEESGQRLVASELRRLVSFKLHELPEPAPGPPGRVGGSNAWDIILCRNVLIHFDRPRVAKTISAFIRGLKPDGLLFLGASEWISSQLEQQISGFELLDVVEYGGAIGYRKRAPGNVRARPAPRAQISPKPVRALEELMPTAPPASAVPPPRPGPVEPQPVDEIDRLRRDGDRKLDDGDLSGALATYRAALRQDDLKADLHLRLGVCCMRLGDEEGAIKALRRAFFLEASLWPAAWLLGDLVATSNRTAAVRYLRQALDVIELNGSDLQDFGLFAPFCTGKAAASEAIQVRLAQLHTLSVAKVW